MRRLFIPLFTILLAGLSGCVITRFPQDVATHYAHENIRKLQTENTEIYYSEAYGETARRIAGRLEQCVKQLRRHPQSGIERDKLQVFLTPSNFNNAYVQPQLAGLPEQMVLPQQMSIELFNFFNLGNNEIGDVSCHESVHYVQMQEVTGFWRIVNLLLGDIQQPNALLDSWFLEGLATYYEGRLDRKTGRPHSPVWRGMYESAVAASAINAGDMNVANRKALPVGGNYLVGQHFVEWLSVKYGEEKLWEFVDVQAGAIFTPLWVTLRFKAVYGTSIGAEMDEYARHLSTAVKPRLRTESQKVLIPNVGYFGRVAVAQDGAYAVWNGSWDEVTRITVYERDGRERFSRKLTQILPGRDWITTNPVSGSGLTFSADGSKLSFAVADVTSLGDDITRAFVLDAKNGDLLAKVPSFVGLGGGLSPDGRSFLAIETAQQQANLVRIDIESGKQEQLTQFNGHESLGGATYSPNGQRIAFSRWSGDGFDLYVRENDGRIRALTSDHEFNYGPRWVDSSRVTFMRNERFHGQPFVMNVDTGAMERIVEVPYVALDVAASADGRAIFLNRDGWHWSLDTAPLPAQNVAVAPPLVNANEQPANLTAQVQAESANLPAKVEADPPLKILSDEPYHSLEGIWKPTARAPFVAPMTDKSGNLAWYLFGGAMGSDRLGLHYWSLQASYLTGDLYPSVSVGYGTYLTAPVFTSLSGSFNYSAGIRDWIGNLSFSRSFFTTPVSLGVSFIDRDAAPSGPVPGYKTRAVGPSLSVSYNAFESTPYGGLQRGISLDGSAAYYPRGIGSTEEIADLRGEIGGALPLPVFNRQQVTVDAVARAVPSDRHRLLRVGGGGPVTLYRSTPDSDTADPFGLPPGIAFAESLRGYEDSSFVADSVLKGGATWRKSFIIDYGWASFLYLFPAYFIRQVDVEAWGSIARTDPDRGLGGITPGPRLLRAAGGAIFYRASIGVIPVSLVYQYAYRFDQGLGSEHIFGFELD